MARTRHLVAPFRIRGVAGGLNTLGFCVRKADPLHFMRLAVAMFQKDSAYAKQDGVIDNSNSIMLY